MFEPGAPFAYPVFHTHCIQRHHHPKIPSHSHPKNQGKPQVYPLNAIAVWHIARPMGHKGERW